MWYSTKAEFNLEYRSSICKILVWVFLFNVVACLYNYQYHLNNKGFYLAGRKFSNDQDFGKFYFLRPDISLNVEDWLCWIIIIQHYQKKISQHIFNMETPVLRNDFIKFAPFPAQHNIDMETHVTHFISHSIFFTYKFVMKFNLIDHDCFA